VCPQQLALRGRFAQQPTGDAVLASVAALASVGARAAPSVRVDRVLASQLRAGAHDVGVIPVAVDADADRPGAVGEAQLRDDDALCPLAARTKLRLRFPEPTLSAIR
jgi:hypothetical protein